MTLGGIEPLANFSCSRKWLCLGALIFVPCETCICKILCALLALLCFRLSLLVREADFVSCYFVCVLLYFVAVCGVGDSFFSCEKYCYKYVGHSTFVATWRRLEYNLFFVVWVTELADWVILPVLQEF